MPTILGSADLDPAKSVLTTSGVINIIPSRVSIAVASLFWPYELRDTEVQQFHHSVVGHENVSGLEIPMNYSVLMRR